MKEYKELLKKLFETLPQPDMQAVPWKFISWDISFFEFSGQEVFSQVTTQSTVVICDIDIFFKEHPRQAQEYFYKPVQTFLCEYQLNLYAHVYAQKQWVVYIPPKVDVHDICTIELPDACVEHITVIVADGSSATVYEKMFSGKGKRIKNVDIILGHNAQLTFLVQHSDAQTIDAYIQYRFFIYQDAQLMANFALLGGKNTITLIDVYLCAQGARADIRGFYALDGIRRTSVLTRQHHIHKQTASNLVIKGIVADEAQAVYYGTITITENAPKTQAYQENKNIMLGAQAKVFSQPNLEIRTDDVACKHATAIGKFDPEQIIYMQSRGIDTQGVERLLLKAFVADVIHPKITYTKVFDFLE